MRLSTRTGLTAVATGLATVLLATSATAVSDDPTPGAPGLGDSYYAGAGNGGYDVAHYDIRLSYQPDTDRLAGTTTILAKATQDLSSFNLDFGLQVDSVRVNNVPARFAKDPDDFSELVVTPRKPLADGQPMTVVVRYADMPSKITIDDYQAWKKTETGALAVDQPIISEWWFPANDHPTDKSTYDVSIAVPDDVSALSNGTLIRRSKTRHGWTRWSWRSTEPQATYLAFLAIGEYDVSYAETPDGQPFVTAYDPLLGDSLQAARASIERTPEVTEWLAGFLGKYPFEAQGGVATVGLGFALETQTRPVYDAGFFRAGANMSVVVHEMAHQWFGNSVALGDWSDIWLNEGFASYTELMWSEHVGEGTADELAEYIYDSYPADHEFWQTLPGDPGPENQFHPAVYDRGALTVHALRKAVGDDAFFEIMRTWLAEKKDSHGTTPEFIAHAERISGQQLDALFETWLFTPGKPSQSPNGPEASTLSVAKQPKSYPEIQRTHRQLAATG